MATPKRHRGRCSRSSSSPPFVCLWSSDWLHSKCGIPEFESYLLWNASHLHDLCRGAVNSSKVDYVSICRPLSFLCSLSRMHINGKCWIQKMSFFIEFRSILKCSSSNRVEDQFKVFYNMKEMSEVLIHSYNILLIILNCVFLFYIYFQWCVVQR